MSYHGLKFETEITSEQVPQDEQLKELRYWCRQFHRRNLAPSCDGVSYGNLSFRIEKGKNAFIITGAQSGLEQELADDCFVRVDFCDFEKKIVYASGSRQPSSESMLHFAIYRDMETVNAVFHGHCQAILNNAGRLGITETKKECPYGTVELVDSVLEVLGDKNFLVMKNHGFICMAENMEQAGGIALEILEKISNKDS